MRGNAAIDVNAMVDTEEETSATATETDTEVESDAVADTQEETSATVSATEPQTDASTANGGCGSVLGMAAILPLFGVIALALLIKKGGKAATTSVVFLLWICTVLLTACQNTKSNEENTDTEATTVDMMETPAADFQPPRSNHTYMPDMIDLAIEIQKGNTEYLPILFDQVEKFIRKKVDQRLRVLGEASGIEFNELYDSGYLAVIEAAKYFKPECGYKFLTFLDKPLKTAFAEVTNARTQKRFERTA